MGLSDLKEFLWWGYLWRLRGLSAGNEHGLICGPVFALVERE